MASERQVVCFGCVGVVPESRVRLIPFFNDDVQRYVDTYRCEQCLEAAMEQTRSRLALTEDAADVGLTAAFFERHGIFIHEYRRGDPVPVVRSILLASLERLRSGQLRLVIGATRPL